MSLLSVKQLLLAGVATFAFCAGATPSAAQVLDFSFRPDDSQNFGAFAPNYNLVTGNYDGPGRVGLDGETPGASESDLIDSNGNDTGLSITMGAQAFTNAGNYNGDGQTLGYPESAADGFLSGNSGVSFTLSNLDPLQVYTFTFYGSRNQYLSADPSTYNGYQAITATYSVAGLTSASGSRDISYNQNMTTDLYNISPDLNGDITVTLTGDYAELNVMTITEGVVVAPEPSSMALFFVGGAAFLILGIRRKMVS